MSTCTTSMAERLTQYYFSDLKSTSHVVLLCKAKIPLYSQMFSQHREPLAKVQEKELNFEKAFSETSLAVKKFFEIPLVWFNCWTGIMMALIPNEKVKTLLKNHGGPLGARDRLISNMMTFLMQSTCLEWKWSCRVIALPSLTECINFFIMQQKQSLSLLAEAIVVSLSSNQKLPPYDKSKNTTISIEPHAFGHGVSYFLQSWKIDKDFYSVLPFSKRHWYHGTVWFRDQTSFYMLNPKTFAEFCSVIPKCVIHENDADLSAYTLQNEAISSNRLVQNLMEDVFFVESTKSQASFRFWTLGAIFIFFCVIALIIK